MPPKVVKGTKRAKASDSVSPRRVRRDALDLIAREAAAEANKAVRQLKDSRPCYTGTLERIPAEELTLQNVNMVSIAAPFQSRLAALKSSTHALEIRLYKWRQSGKRDIVAARGRPSTKALTPTKRLAVAALATASESHLSSGALNAVACSLLGNNVDLNARQQKKVRQTLRKKNGVIRAVSKPTSASLLHAASSKSLLFKLHDDLLSAYSAEPTFLSNPHSVINFDESNDPDRAGRSGFKSHGFTTIERLQKQGYKPLRTIAIADGAGTASALPWYAASGICIAKTPIVKAPDGWDHGPDFRAPPEFYEPARHKGIPYLPGMDVNYFTKGSTRIFCTDTGVNNKECLTRMFIDHVYPLWRAKVPGTDPLLVIYDSCNAHNWTPELSAFYAANNVHVLKLYHNITTASQPLDCDVNLRSRQDTIKIQEELMAVAVFKNAYLNSEMKCAFRKE